MLKPYDPQSDDIWRLGFWEIIRSQGWNLHDGISALVLRELASSFSLCVPWEDTCQTGRVSSAAPSILASSDFSASRTVGHKCLFLKPSRLWYFVTTDRSRLRHLVIKCFTIGFIFKKKTLKITCNQDGC